MTAPRLLPRFLRDDPFQPATGWWRSIEIGLVVDRGLPEGRGLDLACGDGRLTGLLLDETGWRGEIVGLDIDPAETALASASGRYARVVTASAERIPEPDASFDWIFSNSAIEHMDDPDAVFREAARILRPGGRLIFTVPSAGFRDGLRGPLRGDRGRYLEETARRTAVRTFFDPATLPARLRAAGLETVEIVPHVSGPEVRRWETISRWTAGVLYRLVRGRRQPIEIQRALGLRRAGRRLPMPLARPLASLVAARVAPPDGLFGNLYVVAERPAR